MINQPANNLIIPSSIQIDLFSPLFISELTTDTSTVTVENEQPKLL